MQLAGCTEQNLSRGLNIARDATFVTDLRGTWSKEITSQLYFSVVSEQEGGNATNLQLNQLGGEKKNLLQSVAAC